MDGARQGHRPLFIYRFLAQQAMPVDAARRRAPASVVRACDMPWVPRLARVALLPMLTGCRTRPGAPLVIEFWAMGREGEVVQQLVPAFERRTPGVRVRVQQIPWSAAHEKLLTAYVGDAMPDAFQVGNTWIPELVALDALEPLDAR